MALIYPWLLFKILNPFHPLYLLTKPCSFAIVLAVLRIAWLSERVRASLPTIKTGNLAAFIS